jgi:hypothetical protein
MREALALLVPACAIGFVILPRPLRMGRATLCAATLALCLGIGFSSLTSAALVVNGMAPATAGFVLIDVAIWGSIGVLGWSIRRRMAKSVVPEPAGPRIENPASGDRLDWTLRAMFAIAAVAAFIAVVVLMRAWPHGEWDAWAIWNQHARFLFRGGGSDAWRGYFMLGWSQPDYPLLLPAAVARVWGYAGHESTFGPALIAMMFGMANVAVVVTALEGRRAWMAGALMLGGSAYLIHIASQYADVPLAFFMVATLAVAYGDALRGSRIAPVVAGATTTLAAWTKNEGLVFAVVMVLVASAVALRRPSAGRMRRSEGAQLLWVIAGSAPVVIAIVWFKLWLAPSSDLGEGLTPAIVTTRLLDVDRHMTVATLMGQHMLRWSTRLSVAVLPLVGLAALWMSGRSERARVMVAVLGLMLLSFYVVYVLTPYEIVWHITTSFDRLLVQLWPALVLSAFVGLGRASAKRPE